MRSFPRRKATRPVAVSLLGIVALLAGCGPVDGEGSRALYELERMTFVPAAAGSIEGFTERWADCSLDRAIVIDLYEFSRQDGLYYDLPDHRSEDSFITDAATQGDEKTRWPRYMSYWEAAEIAERRGMRLPTAKEWIHVATDRGSNGYPWHRSMFQKGVANTLELDVGTPLPVGTFENGRSIPFGCYDMVGNVWEWVQDVAIGYLDPSYTPLERPDDWQYSSTWEYVLCWVALVVRHLHDPQSTPLETFDERRRYSSIFGGAYDSRARLTFGRGEQSELRFNAQQKARGFFAPSVGARMCADAEVYLWAKAPEWGDDETAQARIRAIGGRWAAIPTGESVRRFLDELASREGAPPALAWLAEGAHE